MILKLNVMNIINIINQVTLNCNICGKPFCSHISGNNEGNNERVRFKANGEVIFSKYMPIEIESKSKFNIIID